MKVSNIDKIRFFHSGYTPSMVSSIFYAECGECDKMHNNQYSYCSIKCKKKAENRLRELKTRAKIKSAYVEPVNRVKVFNACNWHCVMCGINTPRELMGTIEPNSPTLDHIVPLSKGGKHSYANTQLLCRNCNCFIKADKY